MRHAIALAAILLTLAPPAVAAEEPERTLTLTGTGKVSAAPDMATIDIGVVTDGDSARSALDANTAAMNRIMSAIEESRIEAKDIQTSGFSVQPRYFQEPRREVPPKVIGYQVNNTVHVTVRDLDRLGPVLDSVVTGGSNTINRLAFSFSDPDSLLDEARRLAGAHARRKAELYADGLGIELGRITSVSEVGGGSPPVPLMMRAQAFEAADVPIAAGEQEVSASVNVTWEIE